MFSWGGWGCEVSCGGHHRQRGKTTTESALDGAVLDFTHVLSYLVHNMSRSQLYLRFGHFGRFPCVFVGWVGLWGFLWWAPSAKRKDHHGVSSGWSSTWFHSCTVLSSTQYEQIPIIFEVWPFWQIPLCFRGVGGAVRFLVVGTIGKEERPPRSQLWMEQYLISLIYRPI